jgi:hypothetical protein
LYHCIPGSRKCKLLRAWYESEGQEEEEGFWKVQHSAPTYLQDVITSWEDEKIKKCVAVFSQFLGSHINSLWLSASVFEPTGPGQTCIPSVISQEANSVPFLKA